MTDVPVSAVLADSQRLHGEDVGTLKASVKQLSYAGLYGPEGDAGYSSKIRV